MAERLGSALAEEIDLHGRVDRGDSTGLIRLVGPVSTGDAIQIASPSVPVGTRGAVERLNY